LALVFNSTSCIFLSLFACFFRLLLQMIQPIMKTHIDTAKTMASDKIMIESVRLVVWVVEFQPAGRTESS
jgi:hypothetical protein